MNFISLAQTKAITAFIYSYPMIINTLPLIRLVLILLSIYQTQAISLEIYRKEKNGRFTISYHLGYIEDEACKHCHTKGTEKKLALIEVTDNHWNKLFPSKEVAAKNTFSDITYQSQLKENIRSIDGFKGFDTNNSPQIRDIMCTSCVKNNDKIPKSNFIKEVAKQRDIIAELNQTCNEASPQTHEKKEHSPFIKNENNIISINGKKYWYGLLSVLQAILPKDERLQSKIQSTSCEKLHKPKLTPSQDDDPDDLIMLLDMDGDDLTITESKCRTCIDTRGCFRNFSILSAILSDQDLNNSFKINMLHKIKRGVEFGCPSMRLHSLFTYLSDYLFGDSCVYYYPERDDNNALAILLTSKEIATNGYLSIAENNTKIFWDNNDGKHILYFLKAGHKPIEFDFQKSNNYHQRKSAITMDSGFLESKLRMAAPSTCENIEPLKQHKIDELDRLIELERGKLNEHWPDLMQRGSVLEQKNINEPD